MSKRQRELPGVEAPSVKVVEEAADEYVSASESFKRSKDKRDEAGEQLITVMKANKLSSYRYDGKLVVVSAKAKVSVKDADDGEDGED